MRLLLDTHALLWWFDGDKRLSQTGRDLVTDPENEIVVSAASAWEIATKARLGKLPKALAVARNLPRAIAGQGFVPLAMTVAHAERAGWLPGRHRDPFDRMLAAQALAEDLTLLTVDAVFANFGVRTLW